MPTVEITGMSVARGGTEVLTDVSLAVDAGTVVAIVGPNGAGKTTLVETVTGRHRPTTGRVRVLGADPANERAVLAARWSVMPQTGGLPMGLTVREAVALFADLNGHGADAPTLVDQVGLSDVASRRWRRLSGGQQQRLSLAIALTGGPDLLILDEPTAALDGAATGQVLDLVDEHRRGGATVLLTTHRAEEVERLADRVVVLIGGRVAADGTVGELTATDSIVVRLDRPIDPDPVAEALGRPVESIDGGLRVPGVAEQAAVPAITGAVLDAGGNITGVDVGRRPLAELLAELT